MKLERVYGFNMNSAIKFLYNSLVDLSEEGHEVLSYGIFPFKRKYHVVRTHVKSKAAIFLKYFFKHYEKCYNDSDEIDKSKIELMVRTLIKIRDAEIIELPYGLFDTLERCYVYDTIDVANKTLRKIKKYI